MIFPQIFLFVGICDISKSFQAESQSTGYSSVKLSTAAQTVTAFPSSSSSAAPTSVVWEQNFEYSFSVETEARFGNAVSLFGSLAAAGAPSDSGIGSVTILNIHSIANMSESIVVLRPPEPSLPLTSFGSSVSLGPCHLAVCAVGNRVVYIYSYTYNLTSSEFDIPSFTLAATLSEESSQLSDLDFGYSVALFEQVNSTSSTVAIGSPSSELSSSSGQDAGAVFIYCTSSNSSQSPMWTLNQTLNTLDVSVSKFGTSVALYNNTMAIGATQSSGGAVFIFCYNITSQMWKQTSVLTKKDSFPTDSFGFSLAMETFLTDSSAYSVLVVGAPNISTAYVYVLMSTSNSWRLASELTDHNASFDMRNEFGFSVSVNEGLVVVGAKSTSSDSGAGHATSYTVNNEYSDSTISWNYQTTITPIDGSKGDSFGYSLSVFGTSLVVGSPFHNHTGGGGAIYVYQETTYGIPTCFPSLRPTAVGSIDPDVTELNDDWSLNSFDSAGIFIVVVSAALLSLSALCFYNRRLRESIKKSNLNTSLLSNEPQDQLGQHDIL